jgi:hypothetical protein
VTIKKIKDSIIRKIPILCYISGIKYIDVVFRAWKKITNFTKKNQIITDTLLLDNYQLLTSYKKILFKFILAEPLHSDVAFEFLNAKIKILKEHTSPIKIDKTEPILLCCVKDDLFRIKHFINHYRKLGFKYFIFLDNMSTDGTKEFLLEQPDTNVYVTDIGYNTNRREGWINRLLVYYGYDRWYLCVDSDEFFVYPNSETTEIQEFIGYCRKNKIKRVRSLLLDMYSNKNIFNKDIDEVETLDEYCYFDYNSYINVSSYIMDIVLGGPRGRVFSQKEIPFNCNLTKYPLFYYVKGDFQGCSHYQFPYKYNSNSDCLSALLHYKFMKQDLEKYKIYATSENYSSGSIEYKRYIEALEKTGKINFYYDKSAKYTNSDSLKIINFIKSIF